MLSWVDREPSSRRVENFEISIQNFPKFRTEINVNTGLERTREGFYTFKMGGFNPRMKYTAKMVSFSGKQISDIAKFDFQMPPEPVEDIVDTDVGSDYIRLAWKKGRPTDTYQITYKMFSRDFVQSETTEPDENEFLIYHLFAGTKYKVGVGKREFSGSSNKWFRFPREIREIPVL